MISITYDKRLAFTEHQSMAKTFFINIYFAHPSASRDHGLNESTNGLIRQYLPKSKRPDNVTQKVLKHILDPLITNLEKRLDLKHLMKHFLKRKYYLLSHLQFEFA